MPQYVITIWAEAEGEAAIAQLEADIHAGAQRLTEEVAGLGDRLLNLTLQRAEHIVAWDHSEVAEDG